MLNLFKKNILLALFLVLQVLANAASILGPTEVCINETNTYSLSGWGCGNATGCQYIWTISQDIGMSTVFIENIQTTSPVLVRDWSLQSNNGVNINNPLFIITLNITNCSSKSCNISSVFTTVQVNSSILKVGSIPAITGTNVSSNTLTLACGLTTPLNLSIAPVLNAVSYSWTVPAGWTITNNPASSAITVIPSANTGHNSTICVTANGQLGTCSAGSNISTKCITINRQIPTNAPAITLSPGNLCPNGTKTVSVATVNIPNTTYVWSIIGGGLLFSNSTTAITTTTSSTIVKAPAFGGGQSTVKVKIVTPCGSSPFASTSINYGGANAPTLTDDYDPCVNIFQIQDVEVQPSGVTYVWTAVSGGSFIGGTGNSKLVKRATNINNTSFNYNISLSHACGSITYANYVPYSNCSFNKSISNSSWFQVIPNPASNSIRIEKADNVFSNIKDVFIVNIMTGQKSKLVIDSNTADVSDYANGLYNIIATFEDGTIESQKLVIVK